MFLPTITGFRVCVQGVTDHQNVGGGKLIHCTYFTFMNLANVPLSHMRPVLDAVSCRYMTVYN